MTADQPDDWNWERDPLEDEYPMADRLRRAKYFDPVVRPGDAALLRLAMDHIGYWRHCRKPACLRARKCMDAKVECAWRKLPYLQRHFFPAAERMKADALTKTCCDDDGARQSGALPKSLTRPPDPPVL